jgi:DMSO/TMAO reductase YedYZ molybdopterin-dependent catalytic subunit
MSPPPPRLPYPKSTRSRTTATAGFWEQTGYHMRGDPWNEKRYGSMHMDQVAINRYRNLSQQREF